MKKKNLIKQYVLLAKETANVSIGMKLSFTDKAYHHDIGKMEGYSVSLRHEGDFDLWYVFHGEPDADGPWLAMNKDFVESKCEILGVL